MRSSKASSMWLSPNRGPVRLPARLMSACPGSILVAIGEPVLNPALVYSNVASACAAAVTTVRIGCSAGSAGASSPMIYGPLPVSSLPDVVRPASPMADFIFIQADLAFGQFEALFDLPTLTSNLDQAIQMGIGRSKNDIVGQFTITQAATNEQSV